MAAPVAVLVRVVVDPGPALPGVVERKMPRTPPIFALA
jgi:hypothetical protein